MTDDERLNLLPWYVNDTLSQAERVEVQALLARSEEARAEVLFLQKLQDQVQSESLQAPSELGWKRLQRDIRKQPQEPTIKGWWKPGLAAAATIMLAVQVGFWVQQPADTSRLLSQDITAIEGQYWLVQVEFNEDSPWQQVSEIIADMDGRVVDGPSSIGLLRIAVPKDNQRFQSTEQMLNWLQQQPHISHAALEGE